MGQSHDDRGHLIRLDYPAQRIISLAPHLTEVLFHLGLGDSVVGTVKFSDFPEPAKKIPRVGDAFAVSIETIVGLEPDLVVAWSSGGADDAIAKIQSLGIPVYHSEPKTLAGIADSASRIAQLAGQQESGRIAASNYMRKLELLGETRNNQLKPRTFFQISTYDLYTINADHLIGQAISLCGGINVFGHSMIPVPQVSSEAVLVAAPEVIIFSKGLNEDNNWKQRWTGFSSIPAVAENRMNEISADLITRPGFRMLSGIEALCSIIDTARGETTTAASKEG